MPKELQKKGQEEAPKEESAAVKTTMKRSFKLLTAFLLAPLATLHASEAPKQKPNIILILADAIG